MDRALVLFAHGARAPSWVAPFERLRDRLAARLPGTVVRLAFLELMTPTLPVLAEELVGQGVLAVHIVPVFFGQGGHVLRDLPMLITDLQTAFPQVAFTCAKAVGESDAVLEAIADYCIDGLNKA